MIFDSPHFEKWLKIFLEEENKNSVQVKANNLILKI